MAENDSRSVRDLDKAAQFSYDPKLSAFVPEYAEATSQLHGAYRAVATNVAPAALATDVFTLTGSATKTIWVYRIILTGTQTTASQFTVLLAKRSTANSAGTSTTPTVVPVDSGDAAGTAVMRAYTANPTTGNLVGNISSSKIFIPGATTAAFAPGGLWDFRSDLIKGPVLRGTGEVLAVNLNGVTLVGGSLSCEFEWVEV